MTEPKRWYDPILKHPLTRTVAGGAAAAGLATSLLCASPAEAQDAQFYGAGGVFVGYSWGADFGSGVQWGIEGRAGADFRPQFACVAEESFTAGATARFSFLNLDPQLHLGGQAGISWGMVATLADVSLGYRWGEDPGFSLPLGMELQVHMASTYVRFDPVFTEITAGGGVSFPPRNGDFVCAVPGRALHAERGHAALPGIEHLGAPRRPSDVDPELARAIAREWEHRAKGEWASVPAFLQLADQLRLAGAPGSLVRRALVAAEDELRHAIGSARASMVYSGSEVVLGAVTPATRAPAEGAEALRRLAVESWVDGCLGEGKAAAAAAREASLSEIPEVRDLQRTIAQDEGRHAELAWDVLAWTVDAGGDDVRHAVHACRDASSLENTSGLHDGPNLARHGLLSVDAHHAIEDERREAERARLDAILSRG